MRAWPSTPAARAAVLGDRGLDAATAYASLSGPYWRNSRAQAPPRAGVGRGWTAACALRVGFTPGLRPWRRRPVRQWCASCARPPAPARSTRCPAGARFIALRDGGRRKWKCEVDVPVRARVQARGSAKSSTTASSAGMPRAARSTPPDPAGTGLRGRRRPCRNSQVGQRVAEGGQFPVDHGERFTPAPKSRLSMRKSPCTRGNAAVVGRQGAGSAPISCSHGLDAVGLAGAVLLAPARDLAREVDCRACHVVREAARATSRRASATSTSSTRE